MLICLSIFFPLLIVSEYFLVKLCLDYNKTRLLCKLVEAVREPPLLSNLYFVHKFRIQVKGKYSAQVSLLFFHHFSGFLSRKTRIGKIFSRLFDFCLDNFIIVKYIRYYSN